MRNAATQQANNNKGFFPTTSSTTTANAPRSNLVNNAQPIAISPAPGFDSNV